MGAVIYLPLYDEHRNHTLFFRNGEIKSGTNESNDNFRMELEAATLAMKSSRLVDEQLGFPIEKKKTFSITVFHCIDNTKTRLKIFVANRLITNIYTTYHQYYYVNIKKNLVDCTSGRVSASSKFYH